MAKQALSSAFLDGKPSGTNILLEGLTVHVGKEKVTHDSGPLLRGASGQWKERSFYSKKKIMYNTVFDSTDWESLGAVIDLKRAP